MIGKKFGRLTVTRLSENKSGKKGRLMYYCDCDCGTKDIEVVGEHLRSGHTQSCGCLKVQRTKEVKKKYNKYDLSGEYGIGVTSNTSEQFLFDLEDFEKIKNYCWAKSNNGYIFSRDENSKIIYLHRIVMNASVDEVVDHQKHNLMDNRKQFLRIGTQSNNNMNHDMRSDNTSGITGVWLDKRNNHWCSEIMLNKKKIHLGSFKTLEEAAQARRNAEEKYFQEWSFKNSTGKYNNE